MRDLQADLDEFNHWMCDNYDTYDHALIWFIRVLPEAINRAIKAEAENALLRKVVEAARELVGDVCSGCCCVGKHNRCEYTDLAQALVELDKEGER